jgi:hypothetical protein
MGSLKWTKEVCLKDAKKYNTKKEWSDNSGGYTAARINGWLDDCCCHNGYIFEFEKIYGIQKMLLEEIKKGCQ